MAAVTGSTEKKRDFQCLLDRLSSLNLQIDGVFTSAREKADELMGTETIEEAKDANTPTNGILHGCFESAERLGLRLSEISEQIERL